MSDELPTPEPLYASGFELPLNTRGNVLKDFGADIGELERSGYSVGRIVDLKGYLNRGALHDVREDLGSVIGQMNRVLLLDIERKDDDPVVHDRRIVLMEDSQGRRASLSVSLAGHANGLPVPDGEERDVILHGPGYFGGMGLYFDTAGELLRAIEKAKALSLIMEEKAWVCGVDEWLAGAKNVLAGSDWLKSEEMQIFTGLLYSPNGPFYNVITGTDARQTKDSIKNMYKGSRMGGGIGQIVGSTEGITDTPSFVEHSFANSFQTIQERYGERITPLKSASVSVHGFGSIGLAAAETFLRRGVTRVYYTDIVLFDDTVLATMSPEEVAKQRSIKQAQYEYLKEKYGDVAEITLVHSDDFWDLPVTVVAPCSSGGGVIDASVIERMAQAKVEVVLSGANGPLSDLSIAELAHKRGILMPIDTVVNCGPATAAALEAQYWANPSYDDSQTFVEAVLVPHIENNVGAKISGAIAISEEEGISLWQAGKILYQRKMSQASLQ